MNQKIDKVWEVFYDLYRNYPLWPSTFSMCDCGRSLARGNGKCTLCLEEELAEIVGLDVAKQVHEAVKQPALAWEKLQEVVGEKYMRDVNVPQKK